MKKNIFDNDFEIAISLDVDEADDNDAIRKKVARKLGLDEKNIPALEIKRKSIDARRGQVSFVLTIGCVDNDLASRLSNQLTKPVKGEPVLIIGAGPAGLFCAYELARQGIASIVCERGKKVQERRKDLKGLNQYGVVDEDSNYCFGEGGAGTYSDGKLYTRSHKRGNVREILETLVSFGAKESILTDARPHIGSNKLPKVITAMREALENVGVQFLFSARVTRLLQKDNRIAGAKLSDGREILAKTVVMATGHSAKDIYEMLHRQGVSLQAKAFAMGVRIEHPQSLINEIQYGRHAVHKKLPAAYYRLAYTPNDGRGAFSFCMCPGGWIVPAATSPQSVVVNGMSLSKRDSAFANSGFVVSITEQDLARLKMTDVFGGMRLQQMLEQSAFTHGGGRELIAPAVRAVDFYEGKLSTDLPKTSYIPGLKSADLYEMFSVINLPLAERIKEALFHFNRLMSGYLTNEAVLVGVESRTSSPVRIMRDESTLMASLFGLYPCGEGAGYAGGIMSAAMDGIRVARKILE